MTKADLHRLVDELPDDRVDGTAHLLELVRLHQLDPDQAWFWTPEWQQGEREVDDALARGEHGQVFATDADFLAHLETVTPEGRDAR